MEHLTTIRVTRTEIMATGMFQSLNPVLQKMTMRKGSVIAIKHGVNVASNIGFENWEKQTATRYINRMIVKELLDQSLKKV